jgi:hypothetical protein
MKQCGVQFVVSKKVAMAVQRSFKVRQETTGVEEIGIRGNITTHRPR